MTKLDIEYYEWLVAQIDTPRGRTYGELYERMHNLEFVWTVPNDDNRVQDGLDLRSEFLNGAPSRLILEGVTFLEVLIGLSRRVAFTATNGTAKQWAWRLIKNLGLNKMSDPLSDSDVEIINDVLDMVIWRTYDPDGNGGFFPLKNPTKDQTKVEIWYQMNAYVIEMEA